MQHGLDVQHRAHQSRCGADTSAALELVQVSHGEPMAVVGDHLLHKSGNLIQRLAFLHLLCGIVHQQTLTTRGGKRVDNDDAAVGELLAQILCGNAAGLVGGGQRAGESDV